LFDIFVVDSALTDNSTWRKYNNFDGTAGLSQAFIQYQNRASKKLKFNLGLHAQYFDLSESFSIEPRLGVRYQANPKNAFSIGAGMHSQIQPIIVYFTEEFPSGETTNTNLDFTRSIHLAVGWDNQINENIRFKLETYYQKLYAVPVESFPSEFSMLNTGADFGFPTISNLVNEGTGENYAVEITLEKFFSNNFYFLTTASLFESKYTGSDAIERNTLFNTNFVGNFLAGREFWLNKKLALTLDTKVTYSGGRRYTPILLDASIAAGKTVYDLDKIFAEQYKNYFRPDIKIGIRHNAKKLSQTFSVDLQNIVGAKNVFSEGFKESTNSIATTYQRGFFPDVRYQILF